MANALIELLGEGKFQEGDVSRNWWDTVMWAPRAMKGAIAGTGSPAEWMLRKLGVEMPDVEPVPFEQEMLDVALAGAPLMGAQVVFHGTPHIWRGESGFTHGRPRLDKIGTGEGGAAYGWGWYSAQMEDTAHSYGMPQGHGLPFDSIKYQGKEYPNTSDKAWLLYHTTKYGRNQVVNGLETEIERLSKYAPDRASLLQSEIDFVKSIKPDDVKILGGNLYTLDIPDDVIPKLLDWDKPLSEQSEYVKKALQNSIYAEYANQKYDNSVTEGVPTGRSLYGKIVKELDSGKRNIIDALKPLIDQGKISLKGQSQQKASEYLASIGIPGNTHGGVSKGATGAKYVIWDQDVLDRIKILERNAEKIELRNIIG